MDLADVLNVSRADLAVQIKCAVSVADNGLSDGDPWVVVAEDTSILFVSRRIGGNLTKIQVILGVSRLQKNNAIFGFQNIFDRSQCFFSQSLFDADFSKNTEALRLDIDLAFLTFLRADLFTCSVIRTQ